MFGCDASENEIMLLKAERILGAGVRLFLDYAIELRGQQPKLYLNMISDYELAWNEVTMVP